MEKKQCPSCKRNTLELDGTTTEGLRTVHHYYCDSCGKMFAKVENDPMDVPALRWLIEHPPVDKQ